MITLPKISLAPESEAAGMAASDKSAPDAGTFLALLSQAMPGLGDGKALNLDALTSGAQKLALTAGETGETGADGDPQALLDALLAGLNAPTGGQLQATDESKSIAGKLADLTDDHKLNEQDMAALSALFAMLPHQQTAALNPLDSQSVATATVASATGALANALSGDARVEVKGDGKGLENQSVNAQAQPAAAVTAQSPHDAIHAASNADKLFNDANSSNPAAPSAMQPMVSSASATPTPTSAAIATPHTAVLNAQLGTPEWQQAFSQQVTLMTRNGQQSAELRLNPEALGQVHISLKIDDNLAQMQFVSPHSHVRAALEAAMPTLRTQLAESGIQLGQSNISSESFAGQQQQHRQPQHNGSGRGQASFAGNSEAGIPAPASLQRIARGDNAVDIFA